MAAPKVKAGDRVKAFHPARFGVINEAQVVKVGSKYAHLDFGELLGGVRRTLLRNIVEVI